MKATKPLNQNFPAPEKRLQKFFLLTAAKETWLLTTNCYGLIIHPQQTINKIKRQHDFSQGLLVLGLPIYLWFGWIAFLLFSRLFIFQTLKFGFWAKISLLGISGICGFLFLYLCYWIFKGKSTTDTTNNKLTEQDA